MHVRKVALHLQKFQNIPDSGFVATTRHFKRLARAAQQDVCAVQVFRFLDGRPELERRTPCTYC